MKQPMEPLTGDTLNTFVVPQPLTEQYERIQVAEIDDAAGYPTSSNVVDEFRKSIQDGIAIGSITVADMSVFPEWTGPRYYVIDGIHRLRAYRAEGIIEIDAKVYLFARPQVALIHRLRACLHKADEVLYVRALRGLAELVTERLAGRMHEIHLLEPMIDETGAWQAVPRHDPLPHDAAHLAFAFDEHIFALEMTGQTPTTTWERLLTSTLDEVARVVGKSREWLRNEALARYVLFPDGNLRGLRKRTLPTVTAIHDRELRDRVMARWLREQAGVSTLEDALAYLGLLKRDGRIDDWVPRRERSWILSKLTQNTLAQLANQYVQGERAHLEHRMRAARPASPPSVQAPPTKSPTSSAVFDIGSPHFVATPPPAPPTLPRATTHAVRLAAAPSTVRAMPTQQRVAQPPAETPRAASETVPLYSMLIQWSAADSAFVVTLTEWRRVGALAHTHGVDYVEAAQKGQALIAFLYKTAQRGGDPIPTPEEYESGAASYRCGPLR